MTYWTSQFRVTSVTTLLGPLLLFGCGGIHLYDPGRDATAKDVKVKYADLKLPSAVATEKQNLGALLEEELAVVREAHRLRLDLAMLRIVDDDAPIGAAIAGQITRTGQSQQSSFSRRLLELGYPDIAALRAFMNGTDLLSSRAEAVRIRDDLIYAKTGQRAPPCGAADLAASLKRIVEGVSDPHKRGLVEIDIGFYEKACAGYLNAQRQQEARLGGGEISRSYGESRNAEAALATRRATAQGFERSLKQAGDEYEAAIKAQQGADSSENRARVEKAAAALRDVLKQAGKASDAVDVQVLSESRIQAIDTVLTALSGGSIDDKKVSEPDVQRAALVAGDIPALVEEMQVLVKRRRAPAASPLVIEKQHQLLLRDDALRRVSFAEQRGALYETKYNALVSEARFLLAQHDAVCNVITADSTPPRQVNCDTLQVSLTDGALACQYKLDATGGTPPPTPSPATPDCPLSMTWNRGLREGSPSVKRALYEAIAALGGRLAIARPQQDETDFRLAHLSHLEVAASDEYAIRAWDSLITTPVNQLAAYHQSGIKPAELADLIVKAIGLGAIGIGVNR